MPVTIKDVAKEAGVSPATVSRVLSQQTNFYGPKTAKKVQEALKKLGYQKNMLAENLVKRQSNVIAVIVSTVQTNFANQIIQGITKEAKKSQYDVIFAYAPTTDHLEQERITRMLVSRQVSGILLVSVVLNNETLSIIEHADIPYTFVSIKPDNIHQTVSSDDEDIGYQATKYLLSKGHTNIGLAGLSENHYTGKRRTQGYRKALLEYNIDPQEDWIFPGDYSYDSGYKALTYYQEKNNITAVITASDTCAIGILNCATDYQLNIPKDLSLISIDGTYLCQIVRPKITSITQDFETMGKDSVQTIIHIIKDKQRPTNDKIIPCRLDVRDSVQSI